MDGSRLRRLTVAISGQTCCLRRRAVGSVYSVGDLRPVCNRHRGQDPRDLHPRVAADRNPVVGSGSDPHGVRVRSRQRQADRPGKALPKRPRLGRGGKTGAGIGCGGLGAGDSVGVMTPALGGLPIPSKPLAEALRRRGKCDVPSPLHAFCPLCAFAPLREIFRSTLEGQNAQNSPFQPPQPRSPLRCYRRQLELRTSPGPAGSP